MNVLHAPVNVGSQASSLSRAENEARRITGSSGMSWSADFAPTRIVAEADYVERRRRRIRSTRASRFLKSFQTMFYGLKSGWKFDVLHLYFGQTMLLTGWQRPVWGQMDLPLWRIMNKRIFMTFQGCDARIRMVSAKEQISACSSGVCQATHCDGAADEKRRRTIDRISRYCDKVFCLNPDLLQFVPGAEFLPYANLDLSLMQSRETRRGSKPIIVHAPSDRSIKGTALVEQASRELQSTHPHELQLVENVPRVKALEIYRKADILVDQLYVGWYGGFAVEGMALGLPVVAYLNEKHLLNIPSDMRSELPIVSATPETIVSVLAQLLENASWRKNLGERGRRFVERWHHPVKIGQRMLEVYKNPSLAFWEGYDPGDR